MTNDMNVSVNAAATAAASATISSSRSRIHFILSILRRTVGFPSGRTG